MADTIRMNQEHLKHMGANTCTEGCLSLRLSPSNGNVPILTLPRLLTTVDVKADSLICVIRPSAIVLFQFFGTLRTQAFQHIIDAVHAESLRKRNHRNGNVLETERAMAVLAIKMRMLLINRTIATVVTNSVLQRARAIVNSMNQAMKQKQRQGSRYG